MVGCVWCPSGACFFRVPIRCSSGGGDTREAEGTFVESLVALHRVGTHHVRGRRKARSSTSQRSAEPLCTRIKSANRAVSERKVDLLTTACFLPTKANKKQRTGKICAAFFRSMHMALDGWMVAHAPASPAQGLHHHGPPYFNFLISA